MPVLTAGAQTTMAYNKAWGPGCVANTDLVNPVYIGTDKTLNSESDQIPPQGSVTVDGTQSYYMSTLSTAQVRVQSMPGTLQWNNPVGVQIAINALGLAKDTSVQATTVAVGTVKTTLGAPAQDSTVAAVGTGVAAVGTAVNNPSYGPVPLSYGPSKDSSVLEVNTTLGIPAQTADIGALHAPGQTIATDVSNTGVPLLTASTLVKNQAAISQAAGTLNTSATFGISQIGYEIVLTIYNTTGVASESRYHIGLQWLDAGTGIQIGQDDFYLLAGLSAASPHTVLIKGPTKGDQLQIVSEVDALSNAVTHLYTVFQNSRIYGSDACVTLTSAFSAAGLTVTQASPQSDVIASSNFSAGAGSVNTRVLPAFNGLVVVVFSTGSNTTDADLSITNQMFINNAGANLPNQTVFHQKTDAHGLINAEFALPRGQCEAILTNNNAGAQPLGLSLTAAEQWVR